MNNEQTRREIRSTLLRARSALLKEAARMRAISQGHPDPAPELDEEFADRIVEEHRTRRTVRPGRAP